MNIKERIRQLMKEQHMCQKELAKKSGVSAVTISRILNGHFEPQASTLSKLAEAFGKSVADMSLDDDFAIKTFKGVRGYLEYLGKIKRINSFKNLEDFYWMIKDNIERIPVKAKEIRRLNKNNTKKIIDAFSQIDTIDFFKHETLDASCIKTWSFRKSEDERDGLPNDLGNMCGGFPLVINDETFSNSEAAYICGMFSKNTKKHIIIQRQLQDETIGYNAKKVIRRAHEDEKRADWQSFNVQWMLYVVWQKCKNLDFAKRLKSIPSNTIIIENSTRQNSTTALFWGMTNQELEDCRDIIESEVEINNPYAVSKFVERKKMEERNKINYIGKWSGVNCMGKILTVCKWCIDKKIEPPIDYELLRSKNIYLFGELLTF